VRPDVDEVAAVDDAGDDGASVAPVALEVGVRDVAAARPAPAAELLARLADGDLAPAVVLVGQPVNPAAVRRGRRLGEVAPPFGLGRLGVVAKVKNPVPCAGGGLGGIYRVGAR